MAGKKTVNYDIAIVGANGIVGQILERGVVSKDEAIQSCNEASKRYADTKIVVIENSSQIVHEGQK